DGQREADGRVQVAAADVADGVDCAGDAEAEAEGGARDAGDVALAEVESGAGQLADVVGARDEGDGGAAAEQDEDERADRLGDRPLGQGWLGRGCGVYGAHGISIQAGTIPGVCPNTGTAPSPRY